MRASRRTEHNRQDLRLEVVVAEQRIYLFEKDRVIKRYSISTSKYGVGNRQGSQKTPLGRHRIAQKIGQGAALYTIFRERENTGVLAKPDSANLGGSDDVITSRIMWLEGLEPGLNKGKGVDTFERCIYIHGTAEEDLIGQRASHGCVRMKNSDIAELFDLVYVGTAVRIR